MKIIAIDGPSCSGKTSFSNIISSNVVHIDDFYLPLNKRTKEIMNTLGGNIDFDRLLNEIIIPYKENKEVNYRPYDCHNDKFLETVKLDNNKDLIIEGAYSHHPKISKYIDYKIFIDVDFNTQRKRILIRNKNNANDFFNIWIKRENDYFNILKIKESCDLLMERTIKIKGIYKHFKGNLYYVEDVAKNSEDEKLYVVYRQLYGDNSLWIRPLDMFLSEVDHDKYPDIKQKYRFELLENN